jgi:hypothetical protein
VDLTAFADALQQSGISEWMRASLKALPIIEAIHVMAVATVFGTIFIVDLRLLGYRDMTRPFTRVFAETLRWTWAGFGLAVVTGALLFLPNARTYVANTAFALKMLGLVGAGINMAVFQFTTLRSVASWDSSAQVPLGARIVGATSILIWTWVIVCGRWIGFTKGYDFTVPKEMDLDFDFSQGLLRFLENIWLA